jgi:hypothetical protein
VNYTLAGSTISQAFGAKATRMIELNKYTKFVFVICALILEIAAIFYINDNKLTFGPVIRSDGEAYYAYLPAIFIYKDITLRTTVARPLHGVPVHSSILWGETTRYLLKTPIGEALLMTPFFWLGYATAYFSHASLNGYSQPFQYAAAFSGAFYTAFGLLLLWTVLEKYFKQKSILIVLTGLLFGTNLFHYATYDAIFSHTYSFFLFALFLYLVEHVYRKSTLLDFIALGLAGGMIIITRNFNVLWLLFGVFFDINSRQDVSQRFEFLKLHWKKIIPALVAFLLVISIQLIYWRMITKSFFVFSYPGENFNFTKPEILNVLFSVRKGLFFWSPILLTIFPGMFFVRKAAKEYFLPILIFFPINLYLISAWWSWWFGGSFGHRGFTESLPMFAIAFCALYEGLEATRWKRVLQVAIVITSTLSIWLMLKYWLGIIPFDGTTWDFFIKTFFSLKRPGAN